MNRTLIVTLSAATLTFVSCDFNQPLPGGGGYSPLDAPSVGGAQLEGGDAVAKTPSIYTPGAYLQTTTAAAFFDDFPKGSDQPSKMLPSGTEVKVVSTKGSYVKVEVSTTGAVGYVPAMMLAEKRSPNEVEVTPGFNGMNVTPGLAPEPESIPELPDGLQPSELGDPSMPAE